ncbi:16S rRNA (cytidine(1402)-2'-O)-methyltransferase [Candidatus Roizmanbacteria bacterium CG03_land_8_20_14_0_80_39_12]|uniref:16S rRNA (Cytidine(1402)-2'-O)-methyltransferase n=1 Tax=Candidatus Roizmanbacteria bacterium CG03_land_8_20_14_0_80_39_12 TaxID=1974847 RepID=A0A2M7BTJ4_9BACT|nr:MAG: 16S rRNA (cytidine(1402)-2'-O)-methyltransferase [Candidatus Roizmanbacteria bacterium CG03_land_8_20_14_0_80_39_12]
MLYLVGTPIGNLQDLSLRQAKTILTADVVLAEDTRSAETLISAAERLFSIQRNPTGKVISYYKEREFEKLPYILELLVEGKNIALISEAGMPLISDPGGLLASHCRKKNIPFTVVPGPTSVTTALVLAGNTSHTWTFLGFLPRKENELRKLIEKMKQVPSFGKNDHAFVAFESPERFVDTMKVMTETNPTATITVCREITKIYEEVLAGTPAELAKNKLRGELVLIISL